VRGPSQRADEEGMDVDGITRGDDTNKSVDPENTAEEVRNQKLDTGVPRLLVMVHCGNPKIGHHCAIKEFLGRTI